MSQDSSSGDSCQDEDLSDTQVDDCEVDEEVIRENEELGEKSGADKGEDDEAGSGDGREVNTDTCKDMFATEEDNRSMNEDDDDETQLPFAQVID